uniref:Lamin n=1 Tax=Meloidogyne floridensis TaxID=298350 RepID=A0A915P7K1_9BILA
MSSKAKRSKAQREQAIHVDASADETFDTHSSSVTNATSSNSSNPHVSVRQQEKDYLQSLNDRLAGYIERVRNLETENTRLQVQINEVEIVERKEKESLATRYDVKIEELRKQLEYLTRDKAKLQIEHDKATSGYEELKSRTPQLERDLKKAEKEKFLAHDEIQNLNARLANVDSARGQLAEENDKLKTDLYSAEKQIELLRRQLEDEVLLRTELESRLVTAKEDLEFSRRSHDNQIEEMRRKRQVEMTHYGEEVQHKYETKLQEQLHAMRTDFDSRIAAQRADVEDIFHGKLQEANNQATKYREASARAREEATSLGVRLRELERSTKDHQGIVDGLNRRVKELEGMLRRAHEDAEIRLQQRDEQIAQLKLEIEQLTSDYQDLLDLKVKLDTELHAYHQMLEQEEARLHITPSGSPNTSAATSNLSAPLSTSTRVGLRASPSVFNGSGGGDGFMVGSQRGTKRRRVNQEDFVSIGQSAQKWTTTGDGVGDLIIEEHDVEGKFIRLYNKGDETISVGNWVVRSTAGELETTFKFPSRAKALPGKHVTIWSSNANAEHQPPNSYVMKNQIWPHDRCIRTELLNPDREVNAWRESVLNQSFNGVQYGSDADKNCKKLIFNVNVHPQTSDDFYEVSPNNFYNLESEQQQFPCPPYGMCDFGVENNNQNLENFLINSKSFLLRPSSQQQLTFNENNKENNEFPTLIPPYKINKEFTDPSIITKKEFNNIERQEISGGSSNDIGNNGGINGCTGNWMGEIKDVSLQRSVPAPFPVQMSNIGKNNFNLEEIYGGINNLNNENILNNYGSLIQSNTNSYQFPQSQGYFGGGGYYSSIGNQFGDNNNFVYGNGIPSEFDIEGRDEEEEEEESDDWSENQQQKYSVSTGNLIGEAAARAVLEGLEGKGGKGEQQQMRRTSIDNNKNNYFKLDEQPYIDYLNIVNKNNKNQLIPNIWQSGGGKNLCGSSSPGVAPFVDPCQQSSSTSFSSSFPPPPQTSNNNLISPSKSFINSPPTSFNLNNLLTQPTTNTSISSPSSSLSSSSSCSSNNHYSLRGSDIPFPFGTLQNKEKEEQLLPSNLKEEQHQQPIQKSVTSIQALTQQVYGLPLVTFYVDRIGNGKPRLVERNLEQLTAHRGLPYLFICGTFIGSKEHIQNYHEKHQIPQLVEYVCNGEGKRETTKENITTNNTLSEKQKTQKLKLMDEQQQPLFNEKIKENKNNFKNLKEKKRK